MATLTGKMLLNRYRVDDFIGRGGMAEVYKVWDQQRSTHLAMKVLNEDLAIDRVFIRRFKREAQTLAKLQHPHIVRFYGLEQDGPHAFMLLDYIEGKTLKRMIFDQGGPVPLEHSEVIFRSICTALQYAHVEGLIHCDMKPGNVMINRKGDVLVMDFGIARMTDAATATMVGMGTPAYMAPEQARGLDPVPQTDIYALGIILFEMLTGGERPFTGENAETTGSTSERVRWEQINLEPPSPRRWNPAVTPQLETIISECLVKNPDDRYQTPLDLLNELQQALVATGIAAEQRNFVPIGDIDEYELPAELEPSPPLPVRPTPKPITKQPWFWPAIGIGIIGLGAQIFSGGSKNDPLAVTQTALAIQQTQTALVYVPQQPETITPTEAPLLDLPTSMPLPTQTSTVVAKEQKVRSAAKWPLLLLEPFNNNDNEWLEGEIDDEYAQITMTINGTYSWEISSKQGFIWWVYPTSEIVGDFYLAVEVINPSSNRDAPNGLIFRISENGDHYYYFEVRDTQLFSVWANDRGEWAEIVPYTTSTAIRPSDNNHLEIIAQGDEHFFFINNELVAEKTILSSSQGYTGVAAGLDYEDEHSTIVFDNFELRAP